MFTWMEEDCALARVLPLGELLDHRRVERRDVIGLAAGHKSLVDDDLLVDPVTAGVRTSVCTVGQDVKVRPRTTFASTSTHGPWQIAATGLPAPKKS